MASGAVLFNTGAAVSLLLIALAGAYLPVFLAYRGKRSGAPGGRSLVYVLGNMLSAGVMVSAGFVHLLGTAIKELDPMNRFPLAPFLCGLGFLVTLVADHIAETLSHRNGWHGTDGSSGGHCAPPTMDTDVTLLQHVLVVDHRPQGDKGATPVAVLSDGHGPAGESPKSVASPLSLEVCDGSARHKMEGVLNGDAGAHSQGRIGGQEAAGEELRHSPARTQLSGSGVQGSDGMAGESPSSGRSQSFGGELRGVTMRRVASVPLSPPNLETERLVGGMPDSAAAEGEVLADAGKGASGSNRATPGNGAAEPAPGAVAQVSFLTAALMGVALCFHSVLEGMAMGAQANIVDSVHIFIAIAAHKGLAAYALGSSVVDSQASMQKFWTVIGFFASATPVGILLGVVLSSVANSDAAASVSALASGTFLYVAFMEVIPRELAVPSHRSAKLGMLMLGFAAMSLLAIWA